MSEQRMSLPHGHFDAQGVCHRELTLRALTGREEEILGQHGRSSAERVTALLGSCITRLGDISPLSSDIARALTVDDRQFVMLRLRQLTFGDRVQSSVRCTHCAQAVDIDFLLNNIPVSCHPHASAHYTREFAPDTLHNHSDICAALDMPNNTAIALRYRLPNGGDQELIADIVSGRCQNPALNRLDMGNGAVLSSLMLSRCLLDLGPKHTPSLSAVQALPADFRRALEEEMEAQSCGVCFTMQTTCPECGHRFILPFDIQDFFLGELNVNQRVLQREVHYLAFHYHWSEQDILHMPRTKRRDYIDVLSGEIEKMNHARA